MVEIAQTTSGTWHVLGKYTCKHAERTDEFVERKPLDEFEFKKEVSHADIDVHTLMRNGVQEAFCSHCTATVEHWLTNRQRYLQSKVSPQYVDFSIASGTPTDSCDGCGKPDSDVWIVKGESLLICTTCKQMLEEGAFYDGVSLDEVRTAMGKALTGEAPPEEPPEAPDWYHREQQRKKHEQYVDDQITSASDESLSELTTLEGVGKNEH